ncbi:ATP-binding Cassette (ABC) Superfamily, partial [Thraustotheca clavata]
MVHPIQTANWTSRLLYNWIEPLLGVANERQLEIDDLWPLQIQYQCKCISTIFEAAFKRKRSLVFAIIQVYGIHFAFVGLVQSITVLCTLYGPVVLEIILQAVEKGSQMDFYCALRAIVSLFIVRAIQALLTTHSTFENQLLTMQVTSALQHLLFKKTLALDAAARREKTAGEISNMFSSDIQLIINFSTSSNQIWLIPLQVALILWMLYKIIGWATFVGAAVIIVTLLANHILAKAQRDAYKQLMTQKDTRMKTVNEIFGAIQIIKLNAWEENFLSKLSNHREKELRTMKHIAWLQSWFVALLYAAPVVVTVVSFAVVTLVMKEPLTPSKAFTA